MRSGKKDAFHDFENKTSDAWDDGDDDLLLMSNIPMSIRDVQSTARAVIDNHSRQQKAKSETQRTNALKSKHDTMCKSKDFGSQSKI